MKLSKKIISLMLAVVIIMAFGADSFAYSDATSVAGTSYETNQARIIIPVTKYISTSSGIIIEVSLTINESTDEISGLQSASITYTPDGITKAEIVNKIVTREYILISVSFLGTDGIYHVESAYCYKTL